MIIEMDKVIIIRYSEIALKGKNRFSFEEALRRNLEKKLQGFIIKRLHGKILIRPEESYFSQEEILKKIKETPGVAWFAPAFRVKSEFEKIKNTALYLTEGLTGSFKIDTCRSDKRFHLDSKEVNEKIGEAIVENFGLRVDLKEPENFIYIDISSEASYLYRKKIRGIGGLPVGSVGRAMVLLSAGFDSPVAAYFLMKRGVRVVFIHFHSYPYTSRSSIDQAKQLADRLGEIQSESDFISVPFAEIQKEIIAKTPERLRVILYRRMMMRIAERFAKERNCEALVTGESLGQVASQTLRNMSVIEEAVEMPILRPLLGMDKEEIIFFARELGTYKISVEPYDDCCLFMMPERVETRADLGDVKKTEESLGNIEIMIEKGMADQ